MAALGRKLKSRGHEVIFFGVADTESFIRATGLDFMPICTKQYPPGEQARITNQLSQLSAVEAVQFTMNVFADKARAIFDDLPAKLRTMNPNALILDVAAYGSELVGMQMGIPYVHVSNALHFDYSGYTPPCICDWPHETTPEAFARNREGVEMFLQLNKQFTAVRRQYADQVRLVLDWSDPYCSLSKLAWLTQCPREFDFPSGHWPESLHHVGPLHDPVGNEFGRPPVPFPWDRLSGEPLIYASMGTLQNGSEGVFRTIVEAATAPGYQLVLSIGRHLRPEQIGTVPAGTIVVQTAPQIDLLKRAGLCITHAGLNTALESLAQGVPMVAIPVTSDQPGVAARIAYTKTGLIVPVKTLGVEQLRAAVHQVLADTGYAENARRLQQCISQLKALETAADLIEKAFGVENAASSVASPN
jgi:MGT family glycosyltransferase